MAIKRGAIKWTDEQIQFIVDLDRGHTAKDIVIRYNGRFSGQTAGQASTDEEQTKYLRHHYRNDPRYNRSSEATSAISMRADEQASNTRPPENLHQEASSTGTRYSSSTSAARAASPQHAACSHIDDIDIDNHEVVGTCHIPQPPSDQNLSPLNRIAVLEVIWLTDPHTGCPIRGTHRHDDSGGVYFPSEAAVVEMVRRMRFSISLEDVADVMERLDAQLQETRE